VAGCILAEEGEQPLRAAALQTRRQGDITVGKRKDVQKELKADGTTGN